MTNEERLKRLAYNMGMQSSKDACLAGAEALRLLREMPDTSWADDWPSWAAAMRALLATEVTS